MDPKLKSIIEQEVTTAVAASTVSPTAKMYAMPLLEYWIERYFEEDAKFIHVFVEAPFFIKVAENTFIVGVVDDAIVAPGGYQIVGCEWKTCKAPKKNKGGGDSAYWNEEVWLEQLREGPQISTYALAMAMGTFLTAGPDGITPVLLEPKVAQPYIRIRAAVKDIPPRIWPVDPVNGLFKFDLDHLDYVRRAYLVKAAMVRGMRKSGEVPWQLPGDQCRKFNSVCQHYEEICVKHHHPPATIGTVGLQPTDPACKILPYLGVDPRDPDIVILSYSAYSNMSRCAELGRISTMDGAEGEQSEALDVGSAFHTGVAACGRLMQRGLGR